MKKLIVMMLLVGSMGFGFNVFAEDVVPPEEPAPVIIRQQSGGGLLAELQNQKIKAEAEAKARASQIQIVSKFVFTSFLKYGSTGNEVSELQKSLKMFSVDGKFGSLTEKAVKLFQLNNNLKVDGLVGIQTRAVLNK